MSSLEVLADRRIAVFNGEEVPIGARAFDVLSYLFDNSDRVVSKEELLNAVWAGIMVEESNLTVQVAGLRKVPGRRSISTVPGVGYRLTLEDPKTGPAPKMSGVLPPVPDIPSLVVLPFANLTGDNAKDYLVDGLVYEIVSILSMVSTFFVISSTSSFTYKGRTVDLEDVGRELGVRYVLEGSVQQAGTQMRIATQLVDTETGHTIWQDRFTGNANDIFELQDNVVEKVAGALEPKLIWAEAARARAKPTENLAAYDLCLRASPMVYRQNSLAMLEEALALLRQALELDKSYIFAKALTCSALTVRRQSFWVQRRPKLRERLAHLIGLIMRRVACDASGALRASFV
ncbi:MAG: winged helix-turn-helix domain-containing protein [Rhodobacteraceae bacterium]|nr:winged helix-turn-helix domain-containing protein [Paracoccaceae bacterium]